jgi:hypothetical protein
MKAHITSLVVALAVATPFALAQDKSSDKGGRKSMVFQAGAKAPGQDGVPIDQSAQVDEPGQIASAFFSLLQKSRVEEAYANLTKGSKIAERPEELKSLKIKTSEAIQTFGAIAGSELVESKVVDLRGERGSDRGIGNQTAVRLKSGARKRAGSEIRNTELEPPLSRDRRRCQICLAAADVEPLPSPRREASNPMCHCGCSRSAAGERALRRQRIWRRAGGLCRAGSLRTFLQTRFAG